MKKEDLEKTIREISRQLGIKKSEVTCVPPGYVLLKGEELLELIQGLVAKIIKFEE